MDLIRNIKCFGSDRKVYHKMKASQELSSITNALQNKSSFYKSQFSHLSVGD